MSEPRPVPATGDGEVVVVAGTRPEAVKLAPVVAEMERAAGPRPVLLSTGQHREMLDQVLRVFGLRPDVDLDLMRPAQTLDGLTARAVEGVAAVLRERRPRGVVVQGDTTTAFAAALAAFYAGVPAFHVEAGLRTGDPRNPFPEEMNRRLVGRLAALHLAPTAAAAVHLTGEGVPAGSVVVTGNTVVDALRLTAGRSDGWDDPVLGAAVDSGLRTVLVTVHRRETWGAPLAGCCRALLRLVVEFPDVHVVVPVHRNPAVRDVLTALLGARERVTLCEPATYPDFVRALQRCHLVLTDSGGVQEEAPTFGRPVLVLRNTTERVEGLARGTAALVGTDPAAVLAGCRRLLTDAIVHGRMSAAGNPYGDGTAARRVVQAIRWYLGDGARPDDFRPADGPSAPIRPRSGPLAAVP